MIALEYQVVDPLSKTYALHALGLCDLITIPVYARKGEEGLLEDYLSEKQYLFGDPVEIEVPEDFKDFHIILSDKLKEIDLAKDSGRIIMQRKPIEPSVN